MQGSDSVDELCVMYGGLVLGFALFCSVAFVLLNPFTGFAGVLGVYLFASVFASAMVFGFRSYELGMSVTMSAHELSVSLISGLGFSLAVALVGVLLTGIGERSFLGENPPVRSVESQVNVAVTELGLSGETRSFSMGLLEELRDKRLLRGRDPGEVAGAIVYIASRENGEPRTLNEVSTVVGVGKREIGKAYRSIGRGTGVRIVPPMPSDFVNRFGDDLGLSGVVKDQALELVQQAMEKDFTSGKSPRGIAASAIYLSAYMNGEERTMNEVSEILGVTTVTVRERSKDFIRELGLEDYPEHLSN